MRDITSGDRCQPLSAVARFVALAWIIGVMAFFQLAAQASATSCPAPSAHQIVIYTHSANGGGHDPCVVLGIGDYPNSAHFWPVENDQITAVDVGSGVRAWLFEHNDFAGKRAHLEGGYYDFLTNGANDKTSSIQVFPLAGGPIASVYLGNYPDDRENTLAENAQGIAHGPGYWYWTKESQLLKIAWGTPLGNDAPESLALGIPDALKTLGYDHFGDPDVYGSHLFVPMTKVGTSMRCLAVYDITPSIPAYKGCPSIGPVGGLEVSDAWTAVHPITGRVWLPFKNGKGITEHTVSWSGSVPGLSATGRSMWFRERAIDPMTGLHVPAIVSNMQGGVFNPSGSLLYVSTGYCDTVGALRAFNTASGVMEARSASGYGPFNYETNPGLDCFGGADEPEGLDYLDVGPLNIPGIPEGQLHAIVLDNDTPPDDDDFFFKHYLIAEDLARGKPTVNWPGDYPGGYESWRAVDGILDGHFYYNPGSHTGPGPWDYPQWIVDLKQPRTIHSIDIFNRTDCCGAGAGAENRLREWSVWAWSGTSWYKIFNDSRSGGAPYLTSINGSTPQYNGSTCWNGGNAGLCADFLAEAPWPIRTSRILIQVNRTGTYLQLSEVRIRGY